jgi:hypothetical protein
MPVVVVVVDERLVEALGKALGHPERGFSVVLFFVTDFVNPIKLLPFRTANLKSAECAVSPTQSSDVRNLMWERHAAGPCSVLRRRPTLSFLKVFGLESLEPGILVAIKDEV